MKTQTAVEWLVEQIENDSDTIFYDRNLHPFEKYVDQAKAMEKEQIKDAHLIGLITSMEMEATKQAEHYYQKTYGK